MPDPHPISFLLVIALREEFEYAVQALGLKLTPQRTSGVSYYLIDIPLDAAHHAHGAVAFMGDMGNVRSGTFTQKLLDLLHPRLVVSLGISGSLKSWARLGDVVVASATDEYLHRGKAVTGPDGRWDLQFGGEAFPTTVGWHDLANNAEFSQPELWAAWRRDTLDSRPESLEALERRALPAGSRTEPAVHVQHVASGEVVGASPDFKRWLASHDRNYAALDMESAGVVGTAHAHPDDPQTLVVRGISDPADELKELLDEATGGAVRKWALDGALRFFRLLMQSSDHPWLRSRHDQAGTDLASAAGALHAAVQERYLARAYREPSFLRRTSFELYSRLFGHVAEVRNAEPAPTLFEVVAREVEAGPADAPVQVEGPAGSGKTTFLNVLYWYLKQRYDQGASASIPVYVNLHAYNVLSADGRGERPEAAVVARLQSDLVPLSSLVEAHRDQPIVLIVDGDDEYARYQQIVTGHLLELLARCPYKRIVGLRRSAADGPRWSEAAQFSVFIRSLAADDPAVDAFIADYSLVKAGGEAEAEVLRRQIQELVTQSHLPEIDFFSLGLLAESDHQRKGRTLAGLLRDHCREYVRRRHGADSATVLQAAAEAAFNVEIRRQEPPAGGLTGTVGELVNLHPRVRDYLAAQHVIDEMLRIGAGEVSPQHVLNHVHPYRINRLCKELISGDAQLQEKLLQAIQKVLETPSTPGLARAHACYLAGRVDTRQARAAALELLRRHRKGLANSPRPVYESEEDERVDLLVLRTIAISMAYLGDRGAGQEYVRKLLTDARQDRLNRGFHLDYYGDQEFSQTAPNLVSDDEGGECPRTFEQLRNRLLSERPNPLFEIELQTLCSLAQHRHARGTLARTDADRVVSVIGRAFKTNRVKTVELRAYLGMVREHLAMPDFRVATIYDVLHRIKMVPRSGWLIRGMTDGESVADHTYSAYLLGALFLPQHWDAQKGYSRSVILDMLLWHDAAEAVTGDVLPWNRSEDSDRREREVFNALSKVGTYDGVANLDFVGSYMQQFRGESTLNAKIAHDLDRMENLVQLWVYRIQGRKIPRAERWENELREEITTDLGIQILERLEEYYLPRLEDPAKGITPPPPRQQPDPAFMEDSAPGETT
jgi:nucleoside phosphorylase/5'-deoxynucleotidase YfbR-like HD superfamily hydrolase